MSANSEVTEDAMAADCERLSRLVNSAPWKTRLAVVAQLVAENRLLFVRVAAEPSATLALRRTASALADSARVLNAIYPRPR